MGSLHGSPVALGLPVRYSAAMDRRFDTIALAACLTIAGSSCAKAMYDGPRRPAEAVARLSADDGPDQSYCKTKILKVDGKAVNGGTLELLPGLHSVEVESKDKRSGTYVFMPGGGLVGGAIIGAAMGAMGKPAEVTSGPATPCFKAKPGHTYIVQSMGDNETYKVEIIDEETSTDVKDFCR